ncbi:MAG: glycosyltransferase family 4 protein [Planctomycetes bacterium]|nr:glycosyltransferase family 4 protein [Planctomycetota bacterium]
MRIAIDCSSAAKPERTGVARYCASLVGELPASLGPDDRVTLLHRVSRLARRRWFLRMDDPRFTTAWLNDHLVRVAPSGIDVVHGPDLRIPRIPGVPAVSTVHDLSALDVEGIAGDEFRRRKLRALDDVARRAAVIICISQFTEAALLRRFPAAVGRTRIIPQGIGAQFRPVADARVVELRAVRELRSPYVLFVGQISARKNLKVLLDAFCALHAQATASGSPLDLDLVLAGPVQTGGDEIVAAVRASPVAARVRFLGFATDADLPALYSGAAAFAFPGKAEGFGMPPLEAMACGCPVVAARAGANPATVGDAGLLFDPDDAGDLAAALSRVAVRREGRDSLVARGLQRASQFSWGETARRTVEAYRDAISTVVPAGAPR